MTNLPLTKIVPGISLSPIKPGGPLSLEAVQFLRHLGRGGIWQFFWTDKNTSPLWFDVSKEIELPAWSSIYFSVNPGRNRLEGAARGGIENTATINCLFAEFDQKDERTQTDKHHHISYSVESAWFHEIFFKWKKLVRFGMIAIRFLIWIGYRLIKIVIFLSFKINFLNYS